MIRFFLISLFFFVPDIDTIAATFQERVCEAQVIVEYKFRGMTKEQWEEVIDLEREIGRISFSHSLELKEIINEVYSTKNNEELKEVLINRCVGKTL